MADSRQMPPALEAKEVGAAYARSGAINETRPASTAWKSPLSTSQLKYKHAMDSDEDSYFSTSSESSEKASNIAGAGTTGRKAYDQDSSSDDDSDREEHALDANKSGHRTTLQSFTDNEEEMSVKEGEVGKQRSNVQQHEESEEILRDDECDDEGNYVVNERSRLMEAAQAASIPSDDSFNDDSDFGSPPARLISAFPPIAKSRSETSSKAVPKIVEILQNNDDLESSDSGTSCSLLNEESSIESSSSDYDDFEVNDHQEATKSKARMNFTRPRINHRSPSRKHGLVREESIDPEIDLDGSENSGHSDGDKERKTDVKDTAGSSARFANSTSFKWPSFKTKIFYSFRALMASGSSSGDGSRIISVKYLAREVTEDILSDFFHDAGSILDIRITRDELPGRSGLGSAYVEFKSGAAARKALEKSGKNLAGRLISCDIAYESSRGTRSAPGSGDGKRRQSRLSGSDVGSVSMSGRNQSALGFFDPELHEGDAKFLSRFNEQFNVNSYDEINPPPADNRGDDSSARSFAKGRECGGNQGISTGREAAWIDSYGNSSPMTVGHGKTQAELELSAYYDAEDLEMEQTSKGRGKSCTAWPWRRWRRKGKWRAGPFWVWRKPRWQLWHFTNHPMPTKWTNRKSSKTKRPDIVNTRKNITQSGEPVSVRC